MSKVGEQLRLHIILPIAEKLIGVCSTKWLKQIQSMSIWTPEQVTTWQNEHLQKLVRHVYEHTVYYRRIFDDLGLTPKDIQTIDFIGNIMVMKQMVNWNLPMLLLFIKHKEANLKMLFLC